MRLHGSSIAAACMLVALSSSPAFSQSDTRRRPRSTPGGPTSETWSPASISRNTKRPSRVSRSSVIGARAPIEIAPPSTGSKRSSRATAARRPRESSTSTSRRRGATLPAEARRGGAVEAARAVGGRGRGNAAQGGGRLRGIRTRTGVNTDSLKQPDSQAPRAELSARGHDRPSCAKKCSARRSARRIPRRCTSSAGTWTDTVGARPRTTTAPARRSSWSWRACSAAPTSRPSARSASCSGTMRKLERTAPAPISRSARRCRARSSRPGPANTRSQNGSA